LILGEAHYRRVAAVARERRTSTAAVIGDAIDVGIPANAARKRAAWEQIRSLPLVPMGEPDELAAELDELRRGR
jgi:hypothetical protein